MIVISRRRFLALLAAGLGAAACGTQPGAVVTTAGRVTSTSSPPSTTTAVTSTSTTSTDPPATTTTTTTTTSVAPAVVGPEIICRQAWGAMPAVGTFTAHTIERITIHHTAVVLEENALAPARLRQHQQFHQSRGWPDLAYHFMIDAEGNVYEGRPVTAVGDTGTNYDPTGHLLICCEGNFDEQDLPDAQYQALVAMVAWGSLRYGIEPSDVRGHRDVAATSCPGRDLYSRLEDGTLAGDVAAAATPTSDLMVVCGELAEDRILAIES